MGMVGQPECTGCTAGSTRPAAGRPPGSTPRVPSTFNARVPRPGAFRSRALRAFGLPLAALFLLPGAASASDDWPLVEIEKVTLEGSTTALSSTGFVEGQAILVHIRATSRDEGYKRVRFYIAEGFVLDFLDRGNNANNPHTGVGEGTNKRQFFFKRGESTHTIKINTKEDPAKCKDGSIFFSLLDGEREDQNPGWSEYRIPTSNLNAERQRTIPVRDAGPCPVISIDPDPALERDGVTEGGAFDFTLKRISPKINDPGVRLNWEIVESSARDFLPAVEEGRKSHDLGAYAIGDGGPLNAEHEASVQTRLDPGSGSGTVTVRLLGGDYYLGTKTKLTVPVKDDTGYAGRVLRINDIKVAEDHRYRVGQSYVQGFRLPIQLSGDISKSATNPSVRVSLVNSGGGCQATARARDLGQLGPGSTILPRATFPAPVVLEWDRRHPEAREQAFTSLLMNDQFHEGDETLCVKFDQPKSLKLPGDAQEYFATVTITDDDPAPSVTVDTPSAAEGDGKLDFTVTLTNPPDGKNVTLHYSDTSKGSATSGTDYTALRNGLITFFAGGSDKPKKRVVSVTLTDDGAVEDDETVALRFSHAENADFPNRARGVTVRGVITDNDSHKPQVRLREAAPGAGPVVVREGGTAVFHADLWVYKNDKWQIGTHSNAIELDWAIAGVGGASISNDDFPASFVFTSYDETRTASIGAGKTSVALEVPTRSDGADELTEKFEVSLRSASERTGLVLMPTRPISIRDDKARGEIDDGPTLRISAPAKKATEGNPLKFPVSIGVSATQKITVKWRTRTKRGEHSAEPDKDYTKVSGKITFKPGDTDKVIVVETLDDSIDEPDEDFSVVLTDPKMSGLNPGLLSAVGIIRDNDKRPAITIGDVSATEGDKLTLPITLNPTPAVPVRLEWRVRAPSANGATRGADYTSDASGTITIAAGQSSASLTFPTIDDNVDEPTETFEVALIILRDDPLFFSSNRARQQADILAPLTATATILDNDTPSLSINDVEASEGGKPVVFTVRLSSPRTYPVEVEFKTEDGGGPQRRNLSNRLVSDPARGTGPARDYDGVTTPRTIRFAPGETSKKLAPIRVVDDDELESFSEYFQGVISLKSGTDSTKVAIAKGVGLVRIRDNDTTRYWIANKDTTVREGRPVRIRVKRDQTAFAASGLIGCIEGTGSHDKGHAGTVDRTYPTPPGQIDVYTRAENDAASACGQAIDGSLLAYFSFAEGEDEATFWVNTVDDSRKEPDETFIVWMHGNITGGNEDFPQGATVRDHYRARTVFTILDDDDIHRFRVVAANSPWEGEDAHFDIYVDSDAGLAALKASSNPFVTINVGLATDTAKSTVHYREISNRIDLDLSSVTDPSRRVGRISIPTIQDDVLDGDKTVSVHLSEIFVGVSTSLPFRAAPGGGSATATIRDDEAYHLSIDDAVGDEGDAAAVRVSLSKPAEQDFTIRFRTRQGTAKAPGDFTACGPKDASCALRFPEGATEARFLVPTTEDTVPEETEQFRVVIEEADYANLVINDLVAVVKIRDDDARSVAIVGLADASVPENETWTSATPSTSGVPDGGLAWTLEGDDAARFTIDPDTGVLTLPAQNFEVPADDDKDNVYDITVRVTDEDGNTAAVALSVTVTDVVYGQVNVLYGAVDADGNIRVGEGVSVAPSFSYGPYREQGAVAGAPASVSLRWRITGLGGGGAASTADITLSNSGGPHSLAYSRIGGFKQVALAATADDNLPEQTETFGIELSADNDDVLFHNVFAKTWSSGNRQSLNYAISDDHKASLVIKPLFLGDVHEQDDPATKDDAENKKSYTVKLNFVPPPAGITVVPSLSPATTRLVLDKTSLTFTPANWNVPQTVTATAVDDAVANTPAAQRVVIGHSVTGAGDIDVDTDFPVSVNVIDDDTLNQLRLRFALGGRGRQRRGDP